MTRIDSILATTPPWRIIARGANHLYIRPHPGLAQLVAHYTFTFPAAEEPFSPSVGPLVLMPDISGCIVFELDDKMLNRFWGATTRATPVARDFENAPIRFFVEFRPGGAHTLLGLDAGPLRDVVATVDEVAPHTGKRLCECLAAAGLHNNYGRMLADVDNILLGRSPDGSRPIVGKLLETMARGQLFTVRQAAGSSGYSERHLGRMFNAQLGVGVKTAARVLRINRVLQGLVPGVSLTWLAQQAGYYDQPHFNHDFLAVSGCTPGAYLASMSDFYKEEYKF